MPTQENQQNKVRPTWHQIWMNLAIDLSSRATCNSPNRRVGCVIVSEDNCRVLSVGYNGSPAGIDSICKPLDVVPEGMSRCRCIHAEANAVLKLDYHDPSVKILYTTLSPCYACASLLINAKVSTVVYKTLYDRDLSPIELLRQANVAVYDYEKIKNVKGFIWP